MKRMGFWSWLALILAVVGAINWGLVGLFGFNLVEAIFGAGSLLTTLVYIAVGIAGVGLLAGVLASLGARERDTERATSQTTNPEMAVGGGRPVGTATRVHPGQVQKYLKGLEYPVSKRELIDQAERNGATQEVISTLRELRRDEYNSPNDVSEAIGEIE